MGQKQQNTQQTQQTPNLNAGNTVSTQQPTSECRKNQLETGRTATKGNPNKGNKLNNQRAIQDLLI